MLATIHELLSSKSAIVITLLVVLSTLSGSSLGRGVSDEQDTVAVCGGGGGNLKSSNSEIISVNTGFVSYEQSSDVKWPV